MATTARPMPTTGLPDRVGTNPPSDADNHAKDGIKPDVPKSHNPGRAPNERDKYPVTR